MAIFTKGLVTPVFSAPIGRYIYGTDRGERLFGGKGNDTIEGYDGDDTLYGQDGNDILFGGLGDDTLIGGAGNDILIGGPGEDTLYGGEGDDFLSTASPSALVGDGKGGSYDGGEGTDTLHFTYAWDYRGPFGIESLGWEINLDRGSAVINGFANSPGSRGYSTITNIENVIGSNQDDKIYGNNEDNVLDGRAGDDYIYGSRGHDTINGGSGNDKLYGASGWDTIDGGSGNDRIFGGSGRDTLEGGSGNDTIYGNSGSDTISGGSGRDYMDGGSGTDTVDFTHSTTGGQLDLQYGYSVGQGTSYEIVRNFENAEMGRGDDVVNGTSGRNTINGNGGNDTLNGRGGNDTLIAGSGHDTLTGGSGFDTFVFDNWYDNDRDVVTDFQVGQDRLDLSATKFDDFAELLRGAMQVNDDILLLTGSSGYIKLEDVQVEDLSANDFIF